MSDSLKTVTLTSTYSYTDAVAENSGGIDRITVTSGAQQITGFSVADISVADKGGAVCKTVVNYEHLDISDSSFVRVSTTGSQDGGAVYIAGYGDFANNFFSENYAANRGGAIAFAGNASGVLSISGSTFKLNRAANSGGAIRASYGNLSVSGSTFTGNTATNGQGGAILLESYYKHNPHSISDVLFDSNEAKGNNGKGGALFIGTNQAGNMSKTTISGSTFTGNIAASGNGGALYNDFGDVTLSGSSFLTASDTVYNNSKLTVTGNMVFAADLITSENGQTTVKDATLTFVNSEAVTVSNFTIDGTVKLAFDGAEVAFTEQSLNGVSGAAITKTGYGVIASGIADVEKIAFTVNGTAKTLNTVANNATSALKYNADTAKLYIARGVVLADGNNGSYASFDAATTADSTPIEYITATSGTHTVDGFTAIGNKISGSGAAIYSRYAVVNLKNSFIAQNSATNAGGIYFGMNWTVSGSTFSGNSTVNDGGAIRCASSYRYNGKLENSLFIANSAGTSGGAIRFYNNTATVSGSTFSGNSAVNDGGAILMDAKEAAYDVTISDSLFTGNSAANGGAIALTTTGNVTISGSTFATASDTIYNLGTMTFSGNIILNASLTGTGTYKVSDGANFTIGKGVDLNNVDFSNATVTVDGSIYKGEAITIATGIGGMDKFAISNSGNAYLTLEVVNDDLVLKRVDAQITEESNLSSFTGNGQNIMTGGTVSGAFIAQKISRADTIATSIIGGSLETNTIGGAFAKAVDGNAEIGRTEFNIGNTAEVKGQVYAGGYFYGLGGEKAANVVQMSVGNVDINLGGTAQVNGNLFAGIHARQAGNVKADEVSISVLNGEYDRIYAGGWAEGNSYSEVDIATVYIKNGKVNFIYGGGANGQGETYVGETMITVGNSAEVGTIFMSGRYGYSATGEVELNWYSQNDMKRLSGVSSAGIDNAGSTVVNLFSDLTADGIDFVDKFVLDEGVKLTANVEFLLGNRTESGLAEGATTFDFTTDGLDVAWDAIAGIDDFEHALFAINGSEAVTWDGKSALAIGDYELTYNKDEKLITLAQTLKH